MRRPRSFAARCAFALSLSLAACGGGNKTTEPAPVATVETTTFAPALGVDVNAAGWTRTSTGLFYRTLASPSAPAATASDGQRVAVRYTGWLSTGTQFDDGDIAFTLGNRQVIAGWDQGIAGMRVGERRRLLIPPGLGYGARGFQTIPGNAVLVFDVELLSVS